MSNEFSIFLAFVLIGLVIGLLFDFFRILRKTYSTPDFVTILEDIAFWLISGIILLLGIFVLNEGKIRAYLFLGLSAGLIIYIANFSKYTMKIGIKFFDLLNKLVIFPMQKLLKVLIQIFFKSIKLIKKYLNKLKIDFFQTKKIKK